MDSKTFQHGKYSSLLPKRLQEDYLRSQSDPQLLSLREEIAVVDARLTDLLLKVDAGESGSNWQRLRELVGGLEEGRQEERLRQIAAVVEKGRADYRAWEEIHAVLEQRRKLVESERLRVREMGAVIPADRAKVLAARLAAVVKEHVTDPGTLAAISADLAAQIA